MGSGKGQAKRVSQNISTNQSTEWPAKEMLEIGQKYSSGSGMLIRTDSDVIEKKLADSKNIFDYYMSKSKGDTSSIDEVKYVLEELLKDVISSNSISIGWSDYNGLYTEDDLATKKLLKALGSLDFNKISLDLKNKLRDGNTELGIDFIYDGKVMATSWPGIVIPNGNYVLDSNALKLLESEMRHYINYSTGVVLTIISSVIIKDVK